MKERPILFSAPMVRAILENRKTQTRRIIQPKHLEWVNNSVENLLAGCWDSPVWKRRSMQPMPYGRPGDGLWVKEAWRTDTPSLADARAQHEDAMSPSPIFYKADPVNENAGCVWRPSIFMPRWASRILLEITDVRVERLQEISEADAEAEGIERSHHGNGDQWIDYPKGSSAAGWIYPRDSYRSLWNSINGAGSWDANPYVWVIGFKRVLS